MLQLSSLQYKHWNGWYSPALDSYSTDRGRLWAELLPEYLCLAFFVFENEAIGDEVAKV